MVVFDGDINHVTIVHRTRKRMDRLNFNLCCLLADIFSFVSLSCLFVEFKMLTVNNNTGNCSYKAVCWCVVWCCVWCWCVVLHVALGMMWCEGVTVG
jgi:hypothetical protein